MMSHQGNIYLSFNLVLLVRVSNEFQRCPKKTILSTIRSQILDHLDKRFNKQLDCRRLRDTAYKSRSQIISRLTRHVPVVWISRKELDGLSSQCSLYDDRYKRLKITRRSPTSLGHVHVWLYWDKDDPDQTDDIEYRLEVLLRDADPEIRVEPFHIGRERRVDQDRGTSVRTGPSESDVYHLASRVCAAFVEYAADFIKRTQPKGHHARPISADLLLKADDGCALRGFDPIAYEEKRLRIPLDPNTVVKKILDIRDAIDLVCSGLDGSMQFFPPVPRHLTSIFEGKDNRSPNVYCRYKFPFGVWFRGQSRVCFDLEPSLFHERRHLTLHPKCSKIIPPDTMYDESSMIHHFKLHEPEFQQQYRDTFEWLCLMQHYDAPSRVLDWSENILISLFFAVWDPAVDCDGAVWVLNAGRLNEITRVSESRRYVCLPDSVDVILRSAMAVSRTASDLRTVLSKQGHLNHVIQSIDKTDKRFGDWLNGDAPGETSSVWRRLAYPVAVFPGRANDRLATQQATFTLHGGKAYDPVVSEPHAEQRLPPTCGLVDISRALIDTTGKDSARLPCIPPKAKPFLDVYVVPSCAKRKIREQLKRLGIHVASAFPELEYQARYIRHQWRFEAQTTGVDSIMKSNWLSPFPADATRH